MEAERILHLRCEYVDLERGLIFMPDSGLGDGDPGVAGPCDPFDVWSCAHKGGDPRTIDPLRFIRENSLGNIDRCALLRLWIRHIPDAWRGNGAP